MNKILYIYIQQGHLKFMNSKLYPFKPFDDKYYYRPKNLTYKKAVVLLKRIKYSEHDELAIQRQRFSKADEFAEYDLYLEQCKTQAKKFIQIKENWNK